jgi:hypothetical protein
MRNSRFWAIIGERAGEPALVIPCLNEELYIEVTFDPQWISRYYTFLLNTFSGYRFHYYNGLAFHLGYNVMRGGPYEIIIRRIRKGTFSEVAFWE